MSFSRRELLAGMVPCYLAGTDAFSQPTVSTSKTVIIHDENSGTIEEATKAYFPHLYNEIRSGELRSDLMIVENRDAVRGLKACGIEVRPKHLAGTVEPSQIVHNIRQPAGNTIILAQYNLVSSNGAALLHKSGLLLDRKNPAKAANDPDRVRKTLSSLTHTHARLEHSGYQPGVKLDAAVMDDWSVIGPDQGRLCSHIQHGRNAQHDEAVSLLRLLKRTSDAKAAQVHLRTHLSKRLQVILNNDEGIYWTYRAQEAVRLVGTIETQSLDKAVLRAKSLVSYRRTVLHPATANSEL